MDMRLPPQHTHVFDTAVLPDISALPAAGSNGQRAVSVDDTGFDVIHFLTDDSSNLHMRALREYGCHVTMRGVDADLAELADTLRGAIVMDTTHLSRCFSFFRQVRARGIEFPLVALVQAADPFDEVLALELGADEVINRQVHPRVLLAQLQAISRRASRARAEAQVSMLRFGALQVDGANRDVGLGGQRIAMTSGEFDLLWLLAQHAGRIVHRDDVLLRLRGLAGAHGNRSIDSRLYRLRRRFAGVPDVATRIKSVRPCGYMFVNSPW